MNCIRFIFYVVGLFLVLINHAFADPFLYGIGQAKLSSYLAPNTAGMVAVEAGPRNYRASGTLGWELVPCHRLKVTGEWLWQNIDFNFATTPSREWVQQEALGVGYQYLLNNPVINYLDLTGYYSHAPSKNLIAVDFRDLAGRIVSDERHIAGSNARGIAPAIHVVPWLGGEASFALNWDQVVYETQNRPRVDAKGYGGTTKFSQLFHGLGENYRLAGSAAARAPFNYYHAEIDWIKPYFSSELLVGVFTDYTQGKHSLTNTSLVGLNVSYVMDKVITCRTAGPIVQSNSLVNWVQDPAVYMPRVLALSDEKINQCAPGTEPRFRATTVPDIHLDQLPFDVSKLFTGNNLTFSLTQASGTAQISSAGIITGGISSGIIVTASGPCGPPVSTSAFNIIP